MQMFSRYSADDESERRAVTPSQTPLQTNARSRTQFAPCPKCDSKDTWKWKKDRGVLGHLAPRLGYTLLTCRGCHHVFYTRVQQDESWSARLSNLFSNG